MAQDKLSERILGTWKLVLREDRAADGSLVPELTFGPDPKGLLFYDRGGNFAAQFMKSDRSGQEPVVQTVAGANNTRAIGGYDAYFGIYSVDDDTGEVTQKLIGALSPENVGLVVTRCLTVVGDTLTVELETTAQTGESVTRRLLWERVA